MERELREWVQREVARRSEEEDPTGRAQLRPLQDFGDEYADPTVYRTVDQDQVGPRSRMIQGLITGDCCGWPERPTSEEVYEAMQADNPTSRQQSMISMVLRARFEEVFAAWMEGAFTWRQIARAMAREACPNPEQVRAINKRASG